MSCCSSWSIFVGVADEVVVVDVVSCCVITTAFFLTTCPRLSMLAPCVTGILFAPRNCNTRSATFRNNSCTFVSDFADVSTNMAPKAEANSRASSFETRSSGGTLSTKSFLVAATAKTIEPAKNDIRENEIP
eukprot:CAMPEP_0118676986 /NCGR_PEP_ID=MMETSP0800-20121206/2363_1 /TAXON_ID=210618 ORGANISM="Striatella unipunctata, Strain CCMP2910" /NCGR_SAMPLE_ID=MMETSP0800 /ASSEMBLY_ACC=CAM_ASM_000638 /LENGTH=131 /DNA_ID=CAMNT_0006572583 /DNA_START=424 /DNA_END=819 /DNA_ORIENTATION=-